MRQLATKESIFGVWVSALVNFWNVLISQPFCSSYLVCFLKCVCLFIVCSLSFQSCPHILHYGKVDADTNSLRFRASRPWRKGEQCFLSYGNYTSSHLITFYGFLPGGDNPYDVIPLGNCYAVVIFAILKYK